jgi:hypothetical protein
MHNINESIWTMDADEITCYSETGVKVFDKIQKAPAKDAKSPALKSNLIVTKDTKHPRNPEYFILHDPYNKLFYTFAWPLEGHYMPCAVMVSNDKK